VIDNADTDPALIAAQALTAENNQTELNVSYAESFGVKATNPYLQQISVATGGAQSAAIADVAQTTIGGSLGGGLPGHFPCFVANTLILMSDWSEKKIIDIGLGDYVKSFDRLGNILNAKVIGKWEHLTDELIEVGSEHSKVTTTPNHRFWIGDGFQEIQSISDYVFCIESRKIVPSAIKGKISSKGEFVVYNLTVDVTHTYIADRFLVSNLKPADE
jgi:hypothetical protein